MEYIETGLMTSTQAAAAPHSLAGAFPLPLAKPGDWFFLFPAAASPSGNGRRSDRRRLVDQGLGSSCSWLFSDFLRSTSPALVVNYSDRFTTAFLLDGIPPFFLVRMRFAYVGSSAMV
ncbi:hypothetical protein PVAP13_9KG112620 [Panicum virgatum]|uniref:Uncharacterized protein n=1 Tax=Panicum virgatum TaxID=38727 RepID=A0A8T0NL63_PANVG|nr:hypothetical protein PVAP13_9KG112620 [Panicum virgatum]